MVKSLGEGVKFISPEWVVKKLKGTIGEFYNIIATRILGMRKRTRNKAFYQIKEDCKLNSRIESNFNQMLKKLLKNPDFLKIVHTGDFGGKALEDFVIRDGIYPGYTQQKFKVLFIGRDSHGLQGYDYSWTTWENLKTKRRGGYKNFDKSIMAIGYILSKGIDIKLIPETVKNIYKYVTHEQKYEDFSFAFINMSKIDNHKNNNYKFSKKSAEIFVNAVGNQLINKQIEIIAPDLIIGLNLSRCGINALENLYHCVSCNNTYKTFHLYKYKCHAEKQVNEINFIDSHKHFSCFSNEDMCSFLTEIITTGLSKPHRLAIPKMSSDGVASDNE